MSNPTVEVQFRGVSRLKWTETETVLCTRSCVLYTLAHVYFLRCLVLFGRLSLRGKINYSWSKQGKTTQNAVLMLLVLLLTIYTILGIPTFRFPCFNRFFFKFFFFDLISLAV